MSSFSATSGITDAKQDPLVKETASERWIIYPKSHFHVVDVVNWPEDSPIQTIAPPAFLLVAFAIYRHSRSLYYRRLSPGVGLHEYSPGTIV